MSKLLCLVSGLLLVSQVASGSDDLAKKHYMAGEAYYQQARYPEAIREFEEAHRLSPKPALLFNIAQAYERWGKVDRAVEYLQRYLDHPAAGDRAAVEERLKNLRERLGRTGIQIRCEVPDAEVIIDGKVFGRTPISDPLLLPPGSHEIKVTRAGFQSFSAFVSVSAGEVVEVAAQLAPLASSPAPAARAAPEEGERRGGRRFLWTWITAGTAAALLITGAVTGGLALSKAGEATETRPTDPSKADSAKILALVSDVTLWVGVGTAVAATVLFFYERRQPESRTVIAPAIGPRQAGVTAAFHF